MAINTDGVMKTIEKRGKRSLFGRSEFIGVVIIIIMACGLMAGTDKTGGDNFYADILRLENVATKIHQSYVEDVSSEDLVDKAIDGMIGILDPHTSFFKQKQYDELRIHTEGKFGGLGIQISIRDKILTVMTPIAGTPAARSGIQSGDQIIKINGKSTRGISIDSAVGKLRGEPGTEVAIVIRRKGERDDMEYTITREIITIPAIPFYSVIDNDMGYILLLNFSQDAGAELEKAVNELVGKKIKGLILDLRSNPGGLLPQAIEVSEKFLERKALVVSTRGRIRGQNHESYSSDNPALPKDIPLVVLVNAASASASEIVAGAIQDYDRGVIMGDTTYGKGSVQSILPLDKEHHLKLTTAHYYTPSGRCINKPENSVRGMHDNDEDVDEDLGGAEGGEPDSSEADTVSRAKKDTTVYRTKGGRIVFGGGGIVPDTIVKLDFPGQPVQRLLIKDVFFKFANAEYPRLKKRKVSIDSGFVINDVMMKTFRSFLDSIDFKYSSSAKSDFDTFKKRAGLVDSTDTAATEEKKPEHVWTEQEITELRQIAARVENIIEAEGKRDFEKSESEIKLYIKDALMVREKGQDDSVVFKSRLARDIQVTSAVRMLRDRKAYEKLLQP
jgi:carboxyl-terminal processing protease